MSKLVLNKSVLNQQKKQLATYQRYLPALELKQQQLMQVKKKAETELTHAQQELNNSRETIRQQLPMLGCEQINLSGLVKIEKLELGEEFVVGIALPTLVNIKLNVSDYALLARPHWVDNLCLQLQKALRLDIEIQILHQRLRLLKKALKSAIQRVNLFSKILVPEAKNAIRKISIYLSDAQAAGVIRAKMTKGKRAHAL